MRLPDGFKRVKGYFAGGVPKPVSYEEQVERALAESRRRALAAKTERAERLRPLIDRLLLVTDFGNYAQDEHMERVALTVLSDGIYDDSTPIGISAHVLTKRNAVAQLWPQQTASRLLDSLRLSDLRVLSNVDIRFVEGDTDWLDSIILAAESTAERAGETTGNIGQIAVVGSMELTTVDIRDVFTLPYDNGAVYQLTGLGEHAAFDWNLISADMGPS